MSFYGSLVSVDGVVVIGGGQSTLITGVLALNYRIPMIALKACGGSGEKIWKRLKIGKSLATDEEINEMGKRGDEDTIGRWVDSIETQATAARRELRRKSGVQWAIWAGLLVFVWVLALPLGYNSLEDNPEVIEKAPPLFLFLLFVAPMVAGASGATVRMLRPDAGTPTLRTLVLGMAAGAIAGVLYVVSHLIANPKPHNFAILLIAVAFGFIAGLTFDAVFEKLEKVDSLRLDALKKVR